MVAVVVVVVLVVIVAEAAADSAFIKSDVAMLLFPCEACPPAASSAGMGMLAPPPMGEGVGGLPPDLGGEARRRSSR